MFVCAHGLHEYEDEGSQEATREGEKLLKEKETGAKQSKEERQTEGEEKRKKED